MIADKIILKSEIQKLNNTYSKHLTLLNDILNDEQIQQLNIKEEREKAINIRYEENKERNEERKERTNENRKHTRRISLRAEKIRTIENKNRKRMGQQKKHTF
jgi:hypothetical protein